VGLIGPIEGHTKAIEVLTPGELEGATDRPNVQGGVLEPFVHASHLGLDETPIEMADSAARQHELMGAPNHVEGVDDLQFNVANGTPVVVDLLQEPILGMHPLHL